MIIVTGANGFIGSALVWELSQKFKATPIVCVDSIGLQERNLLEGKTYSRFLLKDELWDFLATEEAETEVSWILHMGACSSTTEKNWAFLEENNLQYTQRIFEWCRDHKKDLVYASSAATYGAGELGFDDETNSEDLKPLNLYGDSKVLFDRWALKQTNTPPHWYGLKFFNVFGPNEYKKDAMASLVYKAYHQVKKTGELGLFKSDRPEYKDGEQKRDFIYVKQVTEWILELMEKNPHNGIYNMGSGQANTWLDLANAVFSSLEKPLKINWLEIPHEIKNQYQYFTEAKMDKWIHNGMSAPAWTLEKAVQDYVKNYLNSNDRLL